MARFKSTSDDDLRLFRQLKKGDQPAFRELFLRYYHPLIQFIRLTHQDTFLAEEAVQEIFARLWERRETLTIRTSVKHYLYQACRNQANTLAAKNSRQSYSLSDREDSLVDPVTPEQVLGFATLQHDFQAAVDALPRKAKEVFLLKYYQERRHQEIAQSMNISESMVEKHIANALRHLRKKLAIHLVSVSAMLMAAQLCWFLMHG